MEGQCVVCVTQQSGHKMLFFFVFYSNYTSEVNFLSQVSQASPSCPVVAPLASTDEVRYVKNMCFMSVDRSTTTYFQCFPRRQIFLNGKTWPLQGKRKSHPGHFMRNIEETKLLLSFWYHLKCNFYLIFLFFCLKAALYFILEFKSWKTSAHLLHAQLSDAAGKRWLARWLGVYDFTLSEQFFSLHLWIKPTECNTMSDRLILISTALWTLPRHLCKYKSGLLGEMILITMKSPNTDLYFASRSWFLLCVTAMSISFRHTLSTSCPFFSVLYERLWGRVTN